jgi:hypothetical protein
VSLDLQPLRAEDEPFLFKLYASTRRDEIALVGWDKPQQDAFLRMQYNAQRSSMLCSFQMPIIASSCMMAERPDV